MSRRTPRLPKPSQDRQGVYIADFRENLQKIAIRLARHQKSTFVDVPHVDEAFNVLCRIGISRRPIWKRPEFDTSIGGLFLGVALAAPDLLPAICDNNWLQRNNVILSTIIVSVVLTAIFFARGWMKSSLPS